MSSYDSHGSHEHHNYPYDPRTHTYLSPSGTRFPAPPGHPVLAAQQQPRPHPSGLSYPSAHHLQPSAATGSFGVPPTHTMPADNRYRNDRSQLGLAAATPQFAHDLPPHPLQHRSVSHHSSPSLPPQNAPMTRSWTLDTPPHLDPAHSSSHLNLPLTRSPLHGPSESSFGHGSTRSVSPAYSSGPFHGRPAEPRRRNTGEYGDVKPQRPAMKSRKSGPPKAKLGGPGGKTFDEMLAAGEVKERRVSGSPLPEIEGSKPNEESVLDTTAEKDSNSDPTNAEAKDESVKESKESVSQPVGDEPKIVSTKTEASSADPVTVKDTNDPSASPPALTTTDWNDDIGIDNDSNPWGEISSTSITSIPPLSDVSSIQNQPKPTPDLIKGNKKQKGSKRGKELMEEKEGSNPWNAPAEKTMFGFGREPEPAAASSHAEKKSGKRKKKGVKEDVEPRDIPLPLDSTSITNGSSRDVPDNGRPAASETGISIKGIAGLPPKPAFLTNDASLPTSTRLDTTPPASENESGTPQPAASDASAAPVSPVTSSESTDSPNKRTISAAGLGGNAFLRKSLGGLLHGGTMKRRSGSARGSDAASDAMSRLSIDETKSLPAGKTESQAAAMVEAKSPEFETVPLTSDPAPNDPSLPGKEAAKEDKLDAEGVSPTRTITPGKSKLLVQRLQQEREPSGSASPERSKEENEPEDRDSDETITAAKRLRPSAPVFVPPSFVSGGSSDAAAPPQLRPTASSFVPPGMAALGSNASGRSVSSPLVINENSTGVAPVERRASLDNDEQSQKRVKLRPSANAFVPRPGSVRRVPQALKDDKPVSDDGQRIAPDTFSFAPQLVPDLRALAYALTPVPGPASFAPRPTIMAPYGLPRPGLGNAQIIRPGPRFFLQNGYDQFQPRPPHPMMPAPHVNPAFMQRGAIPAFRPNGFGPHGPVGGNSAGPPSSHGSGEMPGLFYQRPVSSVGSELSYAPRDERREDRPREIANGRDTGGSADRGQNTPRGGEPDVPQSARTQARSSFSFSPEPSGKPLPPLPSGAGSKVQEAREIGTHAQPFFTGPDGGPMTFGPGMLTSTPAKVREGNVSADGTFTTADGSPLLPRRLTPNPSPYRPAVPLPPPGLGLPNSPARYTTSPRPIPESPLLDRGMNEEKVETPLAFPRPEIKVDSAADDRRFREWTFPAEREGHVERPSISRRHTMPVEPVEQSAPVLGVASTLAERVGQFRQLLSGATMDEPDIRAASIAEEEEDDDVDDIGNDDRPSRPGRGVSTQSSVEFPLREEKKMLTVVNATPSRSLSPGPIPTGVERRASAGVVVDDAIVESPGWLEAGTGVGPDAGGSKMLERVLEVLGRMEAALSSPLGRVGTADGEEILLGMREEMASMRMAFVESREAANHVRPPSASNETLERISDALERQTSMLSAIRESTELDRDDDLQDRTKEMFGAMLTGQHDILDKIAQSFETQGVLGESLSRIKAVQEEMADSIVSSQSRQPDIDHLRKELEMANGRLIRAQTENEELEKRMRTINYEALQVRLELDEMKSKRDEASELEKETSDELDMMKAARLAAERERDALSEALRAGMAERERVEEALEEAQRELRMEREKVEKHKRETVTLENLASTAAAFHEEVLGRMTRLDEGMFETMGSRVKEYEHVLDRKRVLEEELGPLREKQIWAEQKRLCQYERAMQQNADLRLAEQERRATYESALAQVRHDLEIALRDCKAEKHAKEEGEKKGEELQRRIERLGAERDNALMVASERASWAKMSEVRLQSLTQEAVYWRQFALETDRKKYTRYMASSPFQDGPTYAGRMAKAEEMTEQSDRNRVVEAQQRSPPDTQIKTPGDALRPGSGVGVGGGGEGAEGQMETPTKGSYGLTGGTEGGRARVLIESGSDGDLRDGIGRGE